MKNHQDLHLKTKELQKLMILPSMQRALHFLQLPHLELREHIEQEIIQNPLLEFGEEEDPFFGEENFREQKEQTRKEKSSFLENSIAYEYSLFEYLMQQAKDVFSKEELKIAEFIIGSLDERGFLITPMEEIAGFTKSSVETLFSMLKKIQLFEPKGIGARDLKESFQIQLRALNLGSSLAYKIIDSHFDEMLHNKLPAISKAMDIPVGRIREEIEETLSRLTLHPGSEKPHGHYKEASPLITVDLIISVDEGELTVDVNDEKFSTLRFNPHYTTLLQATSIARETRQYLEEKVEAGRWLFRTLSERKKTLKRIGEKIADLQKDFFLEAQGALTPYTMRELAHTLSLHESTITRACASKYVSSPRGIFPLHFFFTHGFDKIDGESFSSQTVVDMIKEFIIKENGQKPLSDEKISQLLKNKGMVVARRTVAKYRQELKIGNTQERKRHT